MLNGTFALLIAVAVSLLLYVQRRRARLIRELRRAAVERVRYFGRRS